MKMASVLPVVVVVLMLTSGIRSDNVVRYTIGEEEETFIQQMLTGEGLGDFSNFSNFLYHFEKEGKKQHFAWSNCGDPNKELLVIQSVSISPDPVQLPGSLTVNFMANVKKTLDSPLQVALKLEKKILFWIKIPCIHNIGSCTYKDICTMMSQAPCPPVFQAHGIPCQCPFKQGPYNLTNANFNIGRKIPKGDYRLTAKLSMRGEDVGCYKMTIKIA